MFEKIIAMAKSKGSITTAVVNPVDNVSLGGALSAYKEGFITPILCGNEKEIKKCADNMKLSLDGCTIVHCASEKDTLQQAVRLCNSGEAQVLMKGKIHTDHLMGAVVKKENNLRIDKHISHVFAIAHHNYHKLLFITDCAINIAPSIEQKVKITDNAVHLLKSLGIKVPKVAILSATEILHPKMQSSLDASEVVTLYNKIDGESIVEGPLAFDNAISREAADIKGMNSRIAGDVDLLVVPNIESGNILFKAFVYIGKAQCAGVVLGAKVPVILTSRADNEHTRLLSAALACASLN